MSLHYQTIYINRPDADDIEVKVEMDEDCGEWNPASEGMVIADWVSDITGVTEYLAGEKIELTRDEREWALEKYLESIAPVEEDRSEEEL